MLATLPVRLAYEPKMEPHLASPPVDRTRLHIMILDDEDDYHLITRMMLKKAGFQGRLSAYMEPKEAMDHLLDPDDQPDLLFVDINMPATNGFQFLEACCKHTLIHPEKTMVIMCSSSNRPVDMEMARGVGCVHEYIEKPLTAEQFLRFAAEQAQRGNALPTP